MDPMRTILVHGEEQAMRAFAEQLAQPDVRMPRQGQAIVL
jgi:hypothetical protein